MGSGTQLEVTRLLHRIDAGDVAAREALWDAIYRDLHNIAIRQMRNEANSRTLQPTALVHEAWVRLVGPDDGWSNRAHFFGAAARVMREILVDDARRRNRLKRGGDRRRIDGEALELQMAATDREPSEVLAVNEAIERLRQLNKRQADVVVCRYFAGMTAPETAEALGVSLRTVQADSTIAVAWLRRELGNEGACT
ncbi:MAG: sigma-70 family RNA polymerase sigma factor [Phycisphaerales bacterium]|nr:sigma-70 family RNA polymerase sigma factor [Phycisphaerales bacterium]